MDDTNNQEPKYSFPNADRPLDSTQPTQGPTIPGAAEKKTVKFSEVMDQKQAQFTSGASKTPGIQTYNTDVSHAIKSDNMSALQIALAEQRKQEARGSTDEAIKTSSGSSLTKIFIGVLVLGVLIVGSLWWSGYFTSGGGAGIFNKADTGPIIPQVAPIKIESRQIVQVDNKDNYAIRNYIEKSRDSDIPPATMKEIILSVTVKGPNGTSTEFIKLKTEEFFNKLELHAPLQLLRAVSENYTLGAYGSTPRDLFLIFNVTSYDNAFAGMLAWEPYMSDDLNDIMVKTPPKNTQVASSSQVNNSQSVSIFGRDVASERVFADKILFNKDTRILNDSAGNAKMLYSFINPKTLIIVSSEVGFREILSRLTTGQITR